MFAELWGTNELLTSIDAVAIGRPPEQGEEQFHSADQSWLHIDQGAGRVGLHAYQGGVYLETADADDWVFEVKANIIRLFWCGKRGECKHQSFVLVWEEGCRDRQTEGQRERERE